MWPHVQANSPRPGFKLPDPAAVHATSSALAASGFTTVQTPIIQGGQVRCHKPLTTEPYTLAYHTAVVVPKSLDTYCSMDYCGVDFTSGGPTIDSVWGGGSIIPYALSPRI